jgi:hypothetical protein
MLYFILCLVLLLKVFDIFFVAVSNAISPHFVVIGRLV